MEVQHGANEESSALQAVHVSLPKVISLSYLCLWPGWQVRGGSGIPKLGFKVTNETDILGKKKQGSTDPQGIYFLTVDDCGSNCPMVWCLTPLLLLSTGKMRADTER